MMSESPVENKHSPQPAEPAGNTRPAWLKKDFDGMLRDAPPAVPGKPRFEPKVANATPRLPGGLLIPQYSHRLVGIFIILSLVAAFFYFTPQLSESAFKVSGLKDVAQDPTRPARSSNPANAFYARNLNLDSALLNRWSDLKWSLLYSSSDLEMSQTNSKLYSSLLSLKPRNFSSQDFVQAADTCSPPTCQVSWAGMLFDSAALALQAFDVLDKDLKTSTSGFTSHEIDSGGYQPARSCLSKLYADSGWVSCLFQWNNLVTSIRTYTQNPEDGSFVPASIRLIEQVNSAWIRQWNRRLGGAGAPIP
jgi:hypothetical protein